MVAPRRSPVVLFFISVRLLMRHAELFDPDFAHTALAFSQRESRPE
jgi:hypothetical protein